MTCGEFELRLHSAVESRDREALRLLEAHTVACGTAACRAAWDEYVLLERGIAAWAAAAPYADLSERVLGELESRPAVRPLAAEAPSSLSRRNGRMAVSVAAAALALLVGIVWQRSGDEQWLAKQRGGEREGGVSVARTGDGRVDNPSYDEEGIGEPIDLRPLGDSYVAIAQDATHLVTDLALLIVPGGLDEMPADPHAPDWFDHLEERIEPVRTGVTGKLDEWFGPAPST